MIKRKFKIIGMHCASCGMNIDFDLEDMNGVKKSHTNYASQMCEVEYDEKKVDVGDIINSIQKTGYKAQEI